MGCRESARKMTSSRRVVVVIEPERVNKQTREDAGIYTPWDPDCIGLPHQKQASTPGVERGISGSVFGIIQARMWRRDKVMC